jgi:hypothetical protein
MVNKYILDPKLGGFPFPLTLTCIHMAFCTVLSWALVKLGFVQAVEMPMDVYIRYGALQQLQTSWNDHPHQQQ